MKKKGQIKPVAKRLCALLVVLMLLVGVLPTAAFAADSDLITTVTDPQTLTRPSDIYGNDTQNAGKVTVGKSVSAGSVTVPLTSSTNQTLTASDPNSFMVTVSQSAQVVGVIGQSSVPVDVVFVLDTSGSMDDNNRAENMVTAANGLIKNLMESNEQNRVGVVAFSGSNGNNLATTTTVLSALDHYEDESGSNINNRQAASQHITWGSNSAIRGRNANNTVNTSSTRNGKNGGTNIQAGIARGAQMLTGATNITVAVDTNADGTSDTEMVRMPILVILSDGAPTYSADNAQWWNPNGSTQGAGNDSNVYAGEGFLAMLTAAYYKKAIAEHYYGANTEREATIYTIGVSLGSITKRNNNYEANDKTALANLTMNPSQWLGVSINSTSIDDNIKSYWNKYIGRESFNIAVGIKDRNSDGSYSFTASGTNANILASVTDLKYNDKYWATGDSDIATAFDELSTEISKKAMSVPTMVTTTENFSGYVTFTDVLGEYMELKNMTGVVANGKVYQGISFAKHFSDYGEAGAAYNSPEFDAQLREVMQTRLNMSDSMKNDADFVEENIRLAKASEKQAYYRSDTDYDNSLVWWGTTYDVGEEDTNIQNLGYADDDSIAYIEEERAAGRIPTGADCVVRSYFFYGTAGETDQDPHHEYLYFVVRVSRSLTAPYQQTVVISAPASLLSMERVLIREESDGTYTAEVEEQAPSRVIYEVGLRSDINPYTVKSIVADNYKNETVNGTGSVNYNAATDSYSFFTNDWDRTQAQGSHHRAMTKATFDAAADNSFYRYQENETLYVQSGNSYTKYTGATLPNGVYYYAREGYSWSGAATSGKYAAQPQTFYVKVDVEDDNRASIVRNTTDNTWYIPAGLYTASTLQVNGDDVLKDDLATPAANDGNKTGTAVVVAHPHRTGDVNNSHYTVLLGNNGMLTMQAKDAKEVSIDRGGAGTTIINDADGKAVMVGDVLTYTIEATNTTGAAANIVITDRVPVGTEFVSAANNGTHSSGALSWTVRNVAAGASAKVSFKVRVTEAALNSAVVNIENQATVKVGNNPSYTTNTVTNPPEGKKVSVDGGLANGDVQVGSELTYEILYANDTDAVQTVTITDTIPDGTAYEEGTASPAATFSGNKLTWTLNNVQPGVTGTVSFRVKVTAAALNNSDNNIENHAEIKIGNNNPEITNTTYTQRDTGSIKLLKTVTKGDTNTSFTMILTEATGTLEGTFQMTGANGNTVVFDDGKATITGVKHNAEVTISGLPLNAAISAREQDAAGWTPTYTQRIAVVATGSEVQTLKISNAYTVVPASFRLSGTKTYVGTWGNNSTVSFMAQACDANGVVKTGENARVVYATASKGSGNAAVFNFSEITFYEEQTLYYLISESVTDANKIANVDYDKTVYLMKLEVVDEQSELKVSTGYKKGTVTGGVWTADPGVTDFVAFDWTKTAAGETAINFTNTAYAPAQVSVSGGKTMTGRNMMDGEFVFELVDASGKVVSTTLEVDSADKTKGTFEFAPITYTLADVGTHTYTVREVKGALGGVTYDPTNYTVTVVVAKGQNGTLSTTTTYAVGAEAKNSISFTNSYASDKTHAYYVPVANKVLLSREESKRDLQAGEFRFEVVELDSNNGYAVMKELGVDKVVSRGTNVAATAGAVQNDWCSANGAVQFTPIDFAQDTHIAAGTSHNHYYLIREVVGTDTNITYNKAGTVGYLQVTVTDDGAGTFAVTEVKYFATDAFASGTEILTAAVSNGVPTYSSESRITFTNHYGSGEVELSIAFDKKFNYADTDAYMILSGSEFDFEVYEAADGTFTPAVGAQPITVGTNGASGSDGKAEITFTPTHITRASMGSALTKDFYYLVKEVTPGNATELGLKIADPIGVKLTVTDDGYGNLEVANVAYFRKVNSAWVEQTAADKNLFVNTYMPASVSVRLPIDKELVGKDLSYTGGFDQFSFEISGTNLAQPVILTTDKDGLAAHTLTFAAADMSGASFDTAKGMWSKTFTYTVRELDISSAAVNGNSNGAYGKDAAVYTVTVVVTEDGSGQLKAAAYVGNERLEVLTFTNTYTPDPVTLDVDAILGDGKITKTVVYPDGTLVANYDLTKFTFSLVDTMGNKLSTGITSADGKITFDPVLTFTEARDYHYWIVEDESSATGITNDHTRWEVHVEVGYDAAVGKLFVADKNIYPVNRAAESVTEIEFVNTYEPAATAVVITADKTLTGRQLNNGEFYFQLVEQMEVGGKKVEMLRSEAANRTPDQNGKALVAFRVNYTYADIGQHSYLLREVNDGKGGVTYDSRTSKITVTVKDENGQLKAYVGNATASAAVVDSGVDFANTYQAEPVGVQLLAEKKLDGRELKDGEFSFKVFDSTGAQVSAGKNRADGIIVFDTITFEQVGKYTLRVAEINTGDAEITYDEKIYTVYVEVTDNGVGQLTAKVTSEEENITFYNVWAKPEESPKTGDSFNAPLVLSAMICSAAAAVVLVSRKKKEETAE